MKIIELRFKNLNSLSGEWSIDFTNPEYVSDGIFAITGPTGAGKSTILDAICLALYGRTPRLKSVNKSGNEIMSRQTGECFAEVTFETQAGKFRCHWSQHKARKKADGNLIDSKHEISDAVSGRILESKKRDVADAIESRSGMDFDRFTRSMLLAQGGFAAFLQAAPDDRAPILEQITGSEIYSKISKHVHERHRDEHGKLDLLQAETGGIVILNDEDEAALNKEFINKHNIENELGSKNNALGKSILWLAGIDTIKNELFAIDKESEALAKDLKAFETDRAILQKALKTAELDSEFATLSAKREQQKLDFETLKNSEKQLPDQEKTLGFKETDLKNAEEAVAKVKNRQKNELELIKKVRALDLCIIEKKKALKVAESDRKKVNAQLSENKKQRVKALDAWKSSLKKLEQVQEYLSANARDEALIAQLAGITEQVNSLKTVYRDIASKKDQVAKQQKQIKEDSKLHETQQTLFSYQKKKYDAAQNQANETKDVLSSYLGDRLLREYRAERDGLMLEMAYLKKISDLEAERKKLKDGKPCPLCGSQKHPFAEGNIPGMDKTEKQVKNLSTFIEKAEQLENKIKELEIKEKETSSNLTNAEKLFAQAGHKKDESEKNLKRLEGELKGLAERFTDLQNSALSRLHSFEITELPESDIESILWKLSVRLEKWKDCQSKKGEIEKKSNDLCSDKKRLDGIIETIGTLFKEKQDTLDTLKKEFEQLVLDRNQMYGSKNTDDEETRLEGLVSEAEKAEKMLKHSLDQIRQQLNELTTRINTLKESTAISKPKLDKLEASFKISCEKTGFEDEQTFIFCRLPIDKRNKLSQQAKNLDNKQADITARKKDRQTSLSREIGKKITEASFDDLKNKQASILDSLKKLGEEIGAIKQKLTDNTDAKVKYQQQQRLIKAQKRECTRWDALHSLIGSADGKKYRNFAQGLTFELMVSHANRQLEKMTDRYLLIRDKNQPLELNVVDNYQAGEIRSTKNLSGGESFIVSLSLALGLSKMAGRKVRVDSLFLDEGFGSLDEDALETALETLAGLQQDGKLIGVISHVSALKERISTQINIQPISGGKSIVSGPGCACLET